MVFIKTCSEFGKCTMIQFINDYQLALADNLACHSLLVIS